MKRIGSIKSTGSAAATADGDVAVLLGTAQASPAPGLSIPFAVTPALSGAVSGNQAGYSGASNYLWGNRPYFRGLHAPGASIAVQRIYIGLASTAWATLLTNGDNPGPSGHSGACFRYSTAQNDVNWKAMVFNGVAQTIVDTGVPVVAGIGKEFEISYDGAAVHFRINGQDVAEIRSTIPAATAVVRQGAGLQTLEAVAKTFNYGINVTEEQ